MTARILPLQLTDLEQIPHFQPPGWNDVAALFELHFGQDYFYPIKAVLYDKIVGIGELMLTADTAWLGNIIVHPEFRGRGIGTLLTQHLMEAANAREKPLQLLLATVEGAPLYEKLGFQIEGTYHFFKKEASIQPLADLSPHIFKFEEKFAKTIFTLDAQATGEDRSAVLRRFLETAFLYLKEQQPEGFYLPKLGDGLVVAANAIAGTSLLRFREMQGKFFITVPIQNETALEFIQENGYHFYRKAILMRFGEMKHWRPEMIYSRVGGYLG